MTEEEKNKHVENLANMLATVVDDYLDRICNDGFKKFEMGMNAAINLAGNVMASAHEGKLTTAEQKERLINEAIKNFRIILEAWINEYALQ